MMRWRIHTGPFPFLSPTFDGDMWLWRITDDRHFTAITVRFAAELANTDRDSLTDEVVQNLASRGRVGVEACLRWREPPREITFNATSERPVFWGGRR